jgi:ribosomal protein S18 acetylase RimI-like enzyme
LTENCGIGSRLIEEVIKVARKNNCCRVWLITTNDNTRAIRFYQRRGFTMASIHINAIKESRKIKPQIPLLGFDDIPILHEIEFELRL